VPVRGDHRERDIGEAVDFVAGLQVPDINPLGVRRLGRFHDYGFQAGQCDGNYVVEQTLAPKPASRQPSR
jgi:hypothetical protein